MTITVDDECINDGMRGSKGLCAIALGLNKATGNMWLVNGKYAASAFKPFLTVTLPKTARYFQYSYDMGHKVHPITFELDI